MSWCRLDFLFVIFFVLLDISVFAQAPLQLSLEDSIKRALESNENIEISMQGKESAKWQLSCARKAKGVNVSWQTNVNRSKSDI